LYLWDFLFIFLVPKYGLSALEGDPVGVHLSDYILEHGHRLIYNDSARKQNGNPCNRINTRLYRRRLGIEGLLYVISIIVRSNFRNYLLPTVSSILGSATSFQHLNQNLILICEEHY
jgi:hypothetical protein